MTELELNSPIKPGSADAQRLMNYRTRIAEYNLLREPFDEVQARWHEAGLDSHGRYPACLSMLSSFYVTANDLQRIIQTEETEEKRIEAVDLEKSIHESIGRLVDRLHGSTSAERAQEEKLMQLTLSDAENLDLRRLEAREARPEQLQQFEEGWRANSLIKIDLAAIDPAAAGLFQVLYSKDWYPKYNLPSRIAKYEEDKELEVLHPSDLPAYAEEIIKLINKQLRKLKNVAKQRFPDDKEKAKRWRRVMRDMLKQFERHVSKDLSKQGAGIANVWPSLLRPKVLFSLADLDKLLLSLGLLVNIEDRIPTPDFHTTVAVGLIAALRERRYLLMNNTAKITKVLAERYGSDAVNFNTMSRSYIELPKPAQEIYSRALALLPAP